VLPEAKNCPSCFGELGICLGVPGHVCGNLRGPVFGVVVEVPTTMFRATVPEATVDKYGDTGADKDNIGAAAKAWNGCEGDPISQSTAVKLPSHRKLWLGIT